ncbi:MAG: hypothetical protein B6D59_07105 [Campylobacteraceae bacterium 4484_4]|nr:MAG: hypothetical protein B6D59_07105 [Campylobacteraceae bacterium 4484_4]
MVRDIVTYPDKRINITSPDVRKFDEALESVIQDLKDTMEAHHTNAMAAIQIAIPMSVIVIKNHDGSYLELINPRILRKEGSIMSTERTLYFPGIEQTVPRYEKTMSSEELSPTEWIKRAVEDSKKIWQKKA